MESPTAQSKGFQLDISAGYFQNGGVNVMAFDDIYPTGHQSGVSIIMHGHRVATNGDLRFEQTPGQWQPTPKQDNRTLNEAENTITTMLSYPNFANHLKGFNPMIYPDYQFQYEVEVKGMKDAVLVTVNLNKPIPDKYVGKLCFNLELFPGSLFGKPWIMDSRQGIFPPQANGPTLSMPTNYLHTDGFPVLDTKVDKKQLSGDNKGYNPIIADDIIAEPYAAGRRFTVQPDDPYNRFTIESLESDLKLYDGRMNHNNGWFVLSSEIPAGKAKGAVQWLITPHVVKDWLYPPVIQVSQVGYHTRQPKKAVIELDKHDTIQKDATLFRITESGGEPYLTLSGEDWGDFLRYHYLVFPFTEVKEEGLYKIRYGSSESSVFRIADDVYDRGVWQPVLEYFLPVQMCHMRVNEKYRVWHGLCHNDDARMAPVNCLHFDGYEQGPSTLIKYQPGDVVPGLNVGGWHDAGDYDLRVESQSGEAYILTLAYEEFHVDYDVTTINQQTKVTEIHQPDGKNDILQQIEHGLLTVIGGYRSLGRLYRGIISSGLRQYVHLGDSSTMTEGIIGDEDDRWVFTEENPPRELTTAAHLAAAARAMRGFNDTLSNQALQAASELYEITDGSGNARAPKIHAAVELFLTTGKQKYKDFLLSETAFITANAESTGWIICRALEKLNDHSFSKTIYDALQPLKTHFDRQSAENPYGIPYRPYIWGAGWNVQYIGFQYYFLHKAFPELFEPELIFNALNFVLGCHPGSNTASFASGVGTKSTTVAYGCNRADWSYVPGGVVSGTALIRPDFPELLEFPYLWQQMEYVLGGGSSTYMFLVLATQQLLNIAPCN